MLAAVSSTHHTADLSWFGVFCDICSGKGGTDGKDYAVTLDLHGPIVVEVSFS